MFEMSNHLNANDATFNKIRTQIFTLFYEPVKTAWFEANFPHQSP